MLMILCAIERGLCVRVYICMIAFLSDKHTFMYMHGVHTSSSCTGYVQAYLYVSAWDIRKHIRMFMHEVYASISVCSCMKYINEHICMFMRVEYASIVVYPCVGYMQAYLHMRVCSGYNTLSRSHR